MKASRTIMHSLLAVAAGTVLLASPAATNAQVETTTKVATNGPVVRQVKVETGTVVLVSGNDLWVKDSTGQIRHFPNVPASARVTVNGQQLGIQDLKPGMTISRTTITTTTPKVTTTVQTVTGKVFYVNPPTSVILTMDDNTNQRFTIPKGQTFNINGQTMDAFGLKKGMQISATKVVEVPETVVTQKKILAGTMPPPPPIPPNQPVLIAVLVPVQMPAPAPAPVEEAAAPAPAPRLPKTGSSLPLVGLLGLLFMGASFGLRSVRRS
ncbi:MAG: LPXTG cell wall anchor domain-containing protein [Acidobacteriaceae bacterium]|jgi:LPXTG-motif cell wall-anchored protein